MAGYATLLRDHVTLACRSVDRILQAYVPRLQTVGWVCQFLRWQRGYVIPSSAAFGKIGQAYAEEVYRFAKEHGVPVRRFAKGESKEEIARPLMEAAAAEGGAGRVVLIGIAQEKALVWRSWKTKGQERAAHPHREWGRQMAFVNRFCFWCCARRSRCYGARTRSRGWTGPTGRYSQPWPVCSPGRCGCAAWSRRARCCAGTGGWSAGGGPIPAAAAGRRPAPRSWR